MAAKKNLKKNYLKEDKKKLSLVIDNTGSVKTPAYWESTLFSEVYLHNDLKRDFAEKWDKDYDDVVFDEDGNTLKSGFAYFYNEFRNIASTLRNSTNKKLSETDTISKIIVPLLDALGWYDNCANNAEEPFAAETGFTVKGKGKEKSKVYRTDMLLVDYPQEASFISDPKVTDQRKKEARNYCIAPLEAKYWNRITDHKGKKKLDKKLENKEKDDTSGSLSFNEQVLNYMDILHKKWGIVTDGNTWRLVQSELSGESSQRCFEFKIESLLSKEKNIEQGESDNGEFLENAKYFYLFFGKPSYVKGEAGKVFLDEILKESRKYIDSIEEDLKDRFISAMNITCDGLLRVAKENGSIKKPKKEDLDLIRTVAESHLFNILFIKSCEARGVLPTKSPKYYTISLTSIIDRISVFDPEKYVTKSDKSYINQRLVKTLNGNKFKPDGVGLYKNIINLTELIHQGTDDSDNFGFEIKGFRESIFSKEEWDFAQKHHLTDEEMVQVLFQLGYSKSEEALQRNYQQIPYSYFTARQLGSIYESFLEYQLDVADKPMVYLKKGKYKQWVKLTSALQKKLKGFEPIVKKNQLFFTPDNSERKTTGSYYTPDYIVQYIVKETIGPLCNNKTSKEILELKVCDPAMGSGHFLIGALAILTKKYLSALEKESCSENLPTSAEAKRIILENCIYGVDINDRAVKLAKMSLWLESAYCGRKLEKLDDQLKRENSVFLITPKNNYPNRFSCIVTNPPWESIKVNDEQFFGAKLPKIKGKVKRDKFIEKLLKDDQELSSNYSNYIKSIRATTDYILNNYSLQAPKIQGFSTSMAEPNYYKAFIELAIKISDNIGIVMPTGVCTDIGCADLRKEIYKNFNINSIMQFPKDSKVFDNVSQDFSIMLMGKGKDLGLNFPDFSKIKDSISADERNAYRVNKKIFYKISKDICSILRIDDEVEERLLDKLYDYPKIYEIDLASNYFLPKCGSNTTLMEKYITNKKTDVKVAKGEDVGRYAFSNKYNYFIDLLKIKKENKKNIYFDQSTLVLGLISGTTDKRRVRSCIMPKNCWPINSVNYFSGKIKNSDGGKLFAMAILNSSVFEYLVRKNCNNNNINIYAIKNLPMPVFDASNPVHKKIIKLVETRIVNEAKIDIEVYKLFDLDKHEIKFIEDSF